jgi:hypothetical protein
VILNMGRIGYCDFKHGTVLKFRWLRYLKSISA